MATPDEVTVHNLNGQWEVNLYLSDDIGAVLEIQGVNWLIRNVLATAAISVQLKQEKDASTGVLRIDSTQVSMGQTVNEIRVLDWKPRDQSHSVFGTMSIRSRIIPSAEIDVDLKKTNANNGDSDWDGDVIEHYVEHMNWTSTQIWGFTVVDGKRRHTRRSIVKRGDQVQFVQVVYDWVGPIVVS